MLAYVAAAEKVMRMADMIVDNWHHIIYAVVLACIYVAVQI